LILNTIVASAAIVKNMFFLNSINFTKMQIIFF